MMEIGLRLGHQIHCHGEAFGRIGMPGYDQQPGSLHIVLHQNQFVFMQVSHFETLPR